MEYGPQVKIRDNKIDLIRAICTFSIIIAHVSAPILINNIRSFDVISLVIISGMSLCLSSNKSLKEYLFGRIKKLVIPTYLMLIVVFICSFFCCKLLHIPQLYSFSRIARSFLLLETGSMGYVWIIRIYLTIAVFSLIIKRLAVKIKLLLHFVVFNIVATVLCFILYKSLSLIDNSLLNNILLEYFYYGCVYTIIAFQGCWLKINNSNWKKIFFIYIALFLVIQISLSIKNNTFWFSPSSYKFPPELPYISYGLLITLFFLCYLPNKCPLFLLFVSKHSFSIYLWHIIFLHFFGVVEKCNIFSFLENLWVIKALLIFIFSIMFVALSEVLKKKTRGYSGI